MDVAVLANIIDIDDIGVGEDGGGLGFVAEAFEEVGIEAGMAVRDLNRDAAI